MTKKILLSVTAGIIFGMFIMPEAFEPYLGTVLDFGLCALLLFVGIDLGKNKDVFKGIKEMGPQVIAIPFVIAFGSIFGAVLVGSFMGYSWNESAAVASGFGWYSLAPVIISPYSAELSAVAFLSNVTREVVAIVSIPMIAKYLGNLEAIAPAGAAAMDTLLPVVSKSTNPKTAIICFISGATLSILVPILVPFFIGL